MENNYPPYKNVDEFLKAIDEKYLELPKRLQTVARELHFHQDNIAFMGINDLAALMDSPPSALVRFAKTFHFTGYSEMKSLFQQKVTEQIHSDKYNARINALAKNKSLSIQECSHYSIVNEIVQNNLENLHLLQSPQMVQSLHNAVDLLKQGQNIWVMAAGRSFSAAAYFTYLIRYSERPVHWINGLCFNLEGQVLSIRENDVVLVVSYAPYAKESITVTKAAADCGAKIIAVTDSALNEIARLADEVLEIHEYSSFGFRSLTNTMCLLQILFLMYAASTEMNKVETK